MALTRKMLKAMGIEDDQIEQIIEEHVAVKNGLQDKINGLQAKADEADSLRKKLEDAGSDEAKYKKLSDDFEAYKAQVEAEAQTREKTRLYRELVAGAGVDAKRVDSVVRVANLDDVKVENGAIVDADKLTEAIKADWADFIPTRSIEGANVPNPPGGGGGSTVTKEQFAKMSLRERNNLYNTDRDTYNAMVGK